MAIFSLVEKSIWFGLAALGFAILFNVPQRVLFTVWLFGALGGLTKLLLLEAGANIILATFGGSILIGILTLPAAHKRHAPPLVFTIPSVIPMVPGVYAYRMMLGIIKLTEHADTSNYLQVLSDTLSNGLNMFFILLTLAVGGSFPLLITRKDSIKYLRLIIKRK